MNRPKKHLTQQHTHEQQQAETRQQEQHAAREFGSVEELLREDSRNTPVPGAVAQRLQESLKQMPQPAPRSWWRRILGGADA